MDIFIHQKIVKIDILKIAFFSAQPASWHQSIHQYHAHYILITFLLPVGISPSGRGNTETGEGLGNISTCDPKHSMDKTNV